MEIKIQQLIPLPLADQIKQTDVWKTDFTFEAGKKYQIYSASGKGKSTFCHILYGLREDYEGDVFFDGEDTYDFSLDKWAVLRRGPLSFLFQDLRLFPELTGMENIEVKMHLSEHSTMTMAQVILMARDLGVYKCLYKKVNVLSYGERQRLALIRALIQPFEVLVLDEPFSHLDPENIEKAIGWIQKVCQKNQATLILMGLSDDNDGLKFDQVLQL